MPQIDFKPFQLLLALLMAEQGDDFDMNELLGQPRDAQLAN